MQDIELGKKIDELFQARCVVNGWGVNGDGCTDLLLLFCCLLIRPAVLELISKFLPSESGFEKRQ